MKPSAFWLLSFICVAFAAFPSCSDTTLPLVSITAPLTGSTFPHTSPIQIQGTANDKKGLDNVIVKVTMDSNDSLLFVGVGTVIGKNAAIAAVYDPIGIHNTMITVHIEATDNAGNTNEAKAKLEVL